MLLAFVYTYINIYVFFVCILGNFLKVNSMGLTRNRKRDGNDIQQRSLARIEPSMLLLCGMHANHLATKALHVFFKSLYILFMVNLVTKDDFMFYI